MGKTTEDAGGVVYGCPYCMAGVRYRDNPGEIVNPGCKSI